MKGAHRNGPRRRASRLRVLSGKPSGAPSDPRHPEISGGLRRLHRRVHRHLGAFWAMLAFSSDLTGIVLPMRSEENKTTAKSADLEGQSTNQRPHACTHGRPTTNDATCGPPSRLTAGRLQRGGTRSARSPPSRPPLRATPIAMPLQGGRPERSDLLFLKLPATRNEVHFTRYNCSRLKKPSIMERSGVLGSLVRSSLWPHTASDAGKAGAY